MKKSRKTKINKRERKHLINVLSYLLAENRLNVQFLNTFKEPTAGAYLNVGLNYIELAINVLKKE